MDFRRRFSCYIVGGGSLPIRCAEILLERGQKIYGVITSDSAVARWAQNEDIDSITPTDDLIAFLSKQPFDYLFSIVNEHILPNDVLKLPRKGAINYHDAPLPRYAGTHATSWALINHERTHGVSWHLITDLVDGGDIVKQRLVEIAPGETALSLNTKCYEAAINSFTELVNDLAAGSTQPQKQNLQERTFFARYKRPPGGCIISWDAPADVIHALVRGLSFGPHPNPMGSVRLAVNSGFVIIGEASLYDRSTNVPAGTVTLIDHNYVQVATGNAELRLQKFFSVDGKPLAVSDFVTQFGISEQSRFPILSKELLNHAENLVVSSGKHESFWVERLTTLEPAALPYLEPAASSSEEGHYAIAPVVIPETVTELLRNRYSSWNRTEFLVAAFTAYVSRIGGVDSFDIGYNDRDVLTEVAQLERLFAGRLPLRVSVTNSPTFVEHYSALHDEIQRLRRRGPYLRDVFLRYPVLSSLGEASAFQLPLAIDCVKQLSDYRREGQIILVIPENDEQCYFAYDEGLLSEQNVQKIASQFVRLISKAAANPRHHITNLPLISEGEMRKLLVERNQTFLEYPTEKCIHELFESQVVQTPQADAVVFHKERITYDELNQKSNSLANHLRNFGIREETLVGVCLERSIEMVIALMGILKAGGAYVPLDPNYPKERISLMLEDSQASVLLTQESLLERLPVRDAHTVCIDKDWGTIEAEPSKNLTVDISANNLGYVIYTSGSTGNPKGVAIEHRSAVALISWAQHVYTREQLAGVLASTSICFDLSVFELFVTLCSGGKVILAQNALELPQLSAANEVTLINTVPSAITALLNINGLPRSLEVVNLAGEPLQTALVDQIYKEGVKDVFDLYGPSETTTYSTFTRRRTNGAATIGRPIGNTQIYLLDKHQKPVPFGVPGELYIGGAGLARGYLNRPELTLERFITSPFDKRLSPRLYRTGDLARYFPDGNLEFLGRIDHQVKIRGFRIELGEIEATLVKHAKVQKCVVVAREDIPGDRRLVAYVVFNRKQKLSRDEMRGFLKEKLPEHMLPSAYVTVDEIPLTPNGKIDRRALPTPELNRAQTEHALVLHRNTTELKLRQIWEELLGVQPIGVTDNFFDLGGHSLLAVRVFNKISEVFGKNLPLATLLQAPTIAELANYLRNENRSAPWSSLVAIQPEGTQPPLFCVHAGGGNVLFYRDLAQRLGPDQPFYGLQAQGMDRKSPRHASVEEMADHYLKEISTVQAVGPYFLGGACFGGLVALEMAQQLLTRGHEVAMLVLFDTNGPGYPKPLPTTNLLHLSKIYSLIRRAEHHYESFFISKSDEKWAYVQKKADKARRLFLRNIRNSKKGVVRKFYQSTGRIVPPGLDKPLSHIIEAQNAYRPGAYPGQITLFRASKQPLGIYSDPAMGWSDLASGGLDVIEVPGLHGSIIAEPRVKVLAEFLKQRLTEARKGQLCSRPQSSYPMTA